MPKKTKENNHQDDCILWRPKSEICVGLIKKFYKKAHYGECPFYKDFDTELEQEKKCYDRCQETFSPFFSCLLDDVGNPYEINKEEWFKYRDEQTE